jgi:hypothetical protein
MFYQFLRIRISSSTLLTGLLFKAGKWLHRDVYPTNAGYIFLRDWTKEQENQFYSFLRISLDIAQVAHDNQRRVVFVIFPNRIQVENAADLTSTVYDAALPDQRILDYCTEHGLECVDLLPVLRRAYDRDRHPLFFPVDRHMNASGNRLAAEGVSEYLSGHQMTCNR